MMQSLGNKVLKHLPSTAPHRGIRVFQLQTSKPSSTQEGFTYHPRETRTPFGAVEG